MGVVFTKARRGGTCHGGRAEVRVVRGIHGRGTGRDEGARQGAEGDSAPGRARGQGRRRAGRRRSAEGGAGHRTPPSAHSENPPLTRTPSVPHSWNGPTWNGPSALGGARGVGDGWYGDAGRWSVAVGLGPGAERGG